MTNPFPYSDSNKRYHTYDYHLRSLHGTKCCKIPLDGGFTCPNIDGTKSKGGCVYCSARGSGDFTAGRDKSIPQQFAVMREIMHRKWPSARFVAYFQAFTNTYAPVEKLRALYEAALEGDEIVGLAIGTRPDCLPDEVTDLLRELNVRKPISVELGLQTVHPESIRYIRRGYGNEVYLDAVRRLKAAGIEVVTHIILGLPGETAEMAAESARFAVDAGTDGLKFHLLHVLRGTDLHRDYEAGLFRCLELEEYGDWLERCLQEVPPNVTVHRITGDGAKKDLVAPLWSGDKKRVLNYLRDRLQVR